MSWIKHTAFQEVQDQDSWPILSVWDDFEWTELEEFVLCIREVPSSYLGNDRSFWLIVSAVFVSPRSICILSSSKSSYIYKEVLVSYRGRDTKKANWHFECYSVVSPDKIRDFILISSLSLRSTKTQIHYSLFLPPFTAAGRNHNGNTD